MSDEHHFGTVVHHVGSRDLLGPHRTRVVAAQSFGVTTIEHRELQIAIDPRRGGAMGCSGSETQGVLARDELGIHGQTRGETHPA